MTLKEQERAEDGECKKVGENILGKPLVNTLSYDMGPKCPVGPL